MTENLILDNNALTEGIADGITEIGFLLSGLSILGVKLLWCVLIILVCLVTIKFLNNISKNFFNRQVSQHRISMTERKAETLNSITQSIIKYTIYFIGILTILKQLGVNDSSLLVFASAGSVAFGLGAQSIVTDMVEGFFILFEDCYAVGDIVVIQNITGTVEGVTLRSTKIRDVEGSVHIIPNGSVGIVTNFCVDYRNAVIDFGVAYGENINHVISILEDEMLNTKDLENIIETPKVLGVISLDDSAVTLRIVAKCKVKTHFITGNELRLRIKNRLDKENIEIPFPQHVIHMAKEEKK